MKLGRTDVRGAAGAKVAIGFVVLAAILAVVLYGADRYLHRRVESSAAAQLQTQLGTPSPPQLTIAGWPFLTQLATRDVRSAHLVADDLGANDASATPVAHLDMTLTDVTTTDWWQTMTVGHAEGTARLDYGALQKVSGTPLAFAGDGKLSVEQNLSLAGLTGVTIKVTGRPSLNATDQTVTLTDTALEVGSYSVPDFVARELVQAATKPIALTDIPLGLEVTAVDAREDGLHATVAGDDIPVQR